MSQYILKYLRERDVPGYKALPLCELDDDLLCRILKTLPARTLLRTVARTNRYLEQLCDSDIIWATQLACLAWRFPEDVEYGWRAMLGSNKLVYRLALQTAWLDGMWVLEDRPRGGLLRVVVSANGITADILVPRLCGAHPLSVYNVRDFEQHSPFAFEVLTNGEVLVDGIPAFDFFGCSGSSVEETRARVSIFTRPASGRALHFRLAARGAANHCFLCHEGSAERASALGKAATHCPWYDSGEGASAAADASLASPEVFNPGSVQGLWRGSYGPHGVQLMSISLANLISQRFMELVGLKVTGDPNVPCGELAFRAPLNCEDRASAREQSAPRRYACACSFACDCPKSLKGDGALVWASYDVLALAAEHDFVNPAWNAGHLVVLPALRSGARGRRPDELLLVWRGLFSIRFSRVLPEDLPLPPPRRAVCAAGGGGGSSDSDESGDEMMVDA